VQPQCLAFQQAFNGAVHAEWDLSKINDQGIYDVRTATAAHQVLAEGPSAATTTGATPNLHEAAHQLLAVIAKRPVPYRETLGFQQAWNRSGFPGSMGIAQQDGWPHLREDGDYGPRTTRALLTIQIFWLEQGDPTKQHATYYREPVAFEFGRPGATSPTVGLRGFSTAGFDLGQAVQGVVHGVSDFAKQIGDDITHPDRTLGDIAHGVEQVVEHPDKAIADIGRALRPVADTFLSVAQGVVSLIPGIGTGISAALGAAQAVLDGGGPLEVAIRTAYGAIPIPVGLRFVTDPIVDAIIALAGHKSVEETALYVIRDRLPEGFPRDVFDTLAHVLAQAKPIVKQADHVRQHMVNSFVHGHEHAVQQGMRRHVPAAVAAHLRRLPSMHTRFPSVARLGARRAVANVTLHPAEPRLAPAPPALRTHTPDASMQPATDPAAV
jgi:hypothetical protein